MVRTMTLESTQKSRKSRIPLVVFTWKSSRKSA
jgi:hypothetical protein